MDKSILSKWHHKGKQNKGGKVVYSIVAIELALTLSCVYNFPLLGALFFFRLKETTAFFRQETNRYFFLDKKVTQKSRFTGTSPLLSNRTLACESGSRAWVGREVGVLIWCDAVGAVFLDEVCDVFPAVVTLGVLDEVSDEICAILEDHE